MLAQLDYFSYFHPFAFFQRDAIYAASYGAVRLSRAESYRVSSVTDEMSISSVALFTAIRIHVGNLPLPFEIVSVFMIPTPLQQRTYFTDHLVQSAQCLR